MISRFFLAAGLAVVMFIGATTTFMYLGARHTRTLAPPQKPTAATPRPQAFTLPGTLYVAQSGALYSLNAGRFHQLTPEAGWSMPSLVPDGNILAVKYGGYWSDVWVLGPYGAPLLQVTFNQSRYGMRDPSLNHWAFYPRLSPDGKTLWLTYDGLKCDGCYDVSPAVYSLPYGGAIRQARAWTDGGNYTGGDQQPLPLAGGAVIYTKFDFASNIDPNLDDKLVGMLWYTNRPNTVGRALTSPGEDCREPALSPDGTQIAMICTYEKQVSYLTVASWNGSTLGPRRTLVSNMLVAQPIWAPDGSGIAFLAPGEAAGPFQLWFLPRAAYAPPPAPPPPSPTPGGPHNGPLPSPTPTPAPPPVKPIMVTTNAGFDATSPLAWKS
jgi:WD40 repeat protein